MANYALDENYIRTATVQPQSPPPPGYPTGTRVTGGTAPVREAPTVKPNQIDPNTGQLINTGTATTGGTNPPLVRPPITIKPNQIDPVTGRLINTGTATTGGNNPPVQTTVPPFTLPALDGSSYVAQATGNQAGQQQSPYNVATDNINRLLSGDSAYIQNARLRGTEAAQSRGLRNSSIAAGSAERAAIEGAQPILNEIQTLQRQREQLGFQGEQAALDRLQGVNDRILAAEIASRQAMQDFNFKRTLQNDSVLQQDWLSSQDFTRQFNANLALLPINNAMELSNMVAQYALENPEVYTPDIISGMQSFFTGSFLAMMQQYFPNLGYGTTAPTGG